MAQRQKVPQRLGWVISGVFWTVAGGLASLASWRFLQYWYRLFRQPRLAPREIPAQIDHHTTIEEKALQIAAANLRAGIERRRLPDGQQKLVLCAGTRNFREPWARDFAFASFGLLELEETRAVKETLEVFLLYQRPSGQFPVKVHSTSVLDRYLHSLFGREQPTRAPIRPKYVTAHNTISLDGNGLLVIAALNYAARTGDHAFIQGHWPALQKAMAWLESHTHRPDGLLFQGPFADWADSIARQGRVLYTNVIFWKALLEMAQAASRYGSPEEQRHFEQRAEQVKQAINDHFWRADLGYFVTNQVFDNLSSSGNLLAIAWGLTTPEQAHSILDRMVEFGMANPVPTQTVHRAYPRQFIALENRLGGIANYHTSAAWLWLGAWHVIALARMERLTEAELLLYRISRVIVRDGAVHEVYAPTGQYLSSFWYTSEAPLTWSAGMVVYANYVYRRHVAEAQERPTAKKEG